MCTCCLVLLGCLVVRLFACVFACWSVYLFWCVGVAVCLCMYLFVCLLVCLSLRLACVFVCWFVGRLVCSIGLFVCVYV